MPDSPDSEEQGTKEFKTPPAPPPAKMPHPFSKAFVQIEAILKMIGENKHKPLNIPQWAFTELVRLQKELDRLKTTAERRFPIVGEYSDDILQAVIKALPEEKRTKEIEILETIQALKTKTEETRKSFNLVIPNPDDKKSKKRRSPLSLLDKRKANAESPIDQKEESERRRKFGRVGGRKNWRPL